MNGLNIRKNIQEVFVLWEICNWDSGLAWFRYGEGEIISRSFSLILHSLSKDLSLSFHHIMSDFRTQLTLRCMSLYEPRQGRAEETGNIAVYGSYQSLNLFVCCWQNMVCSHTPLQTGDLSLQCLFLYIHISFLILHLVQLLLNGFSRLCLFCNLLTHLTDLLFSHLTGGRVPVK